MRSSFLMEVAMSETYPLPAHAISVWIAGDKLCLGIPPCGDSKPHTLYIPLDRCGVEVSAFGQPLASQRGWFAILDILKERARGSYRNRKGLIFDQPQLGTRADPPQYQLDQILKAMAEGKARKFDSAGKEELSLEDLGL